MCGSSEIRAVLTELSPDLGHLEAAELGADPRGALATSGASGRGGPAGCPPLVRGCCRARYRAQRPRCARARGSGRVGICSSTCGIHSLSS